MRLTRPCSPRTVCLTSSSSDQLCMIPRIAHIMALVPLSVRHSPCEVLLPCGLQGGRQVGPGLRGHVDLFALALAFNDLKVLVSVLGGQASKPVAKETRRSLSRRGDDCRHGQRFSLCKSDIERWLGRPYTYRIGAGGTPSMAKNPRGSVTPGIHRSPLHAWTWTPGTAFPAGSITRPLIPAAIRSAM